MRNKSILQFTAFFLLLLIFLINSSTTINQSDGTNQGNIAGHEYYDRVLLLHKSGRRLHDEQSIASDEITNERKLDIGERPQCTEISLEATTQQRCDYANNCDGEFLMTSILPLVFCQDPSIPSPLASYPILEILFPIMFPIGLLLLMLLLFRLLGSTAENYFSPALEMISSEIKIPPALGGVTLLALGNGAPDVSAVINSIKSNPQEGVPLSLGELTGGGMFVQSVVVGRIVMLGSGTDGGVSCGRELMRAIFMYAIASVYVFWIVERGSIYFRDVVVMLLLYFGYVMIVMFSELHSYNKSNQIMSDRAEHMETESFLIPASFDEEDEELVLTPMKRFHKCDPPDPPGSKHSSRVLRVIKRQQEKQFQGQRGSRRNLSESNEAQDNLSNHQSWSMDLLFESFHDLYSHFFHTIYVEILTNKQLSNFEWHSMILEIPFVIVRKFVIPIPCEGEYNRSMVAFSLACSPLWLFYYHGTKLGDVIDMKLRVLTIIASFTVGAIIIRFCDKEKGMPLKYGIAVAFYGFLIAATWIDVISEHLVNVLELIGVLLRIPSPVMGMTILAWGNSVGDWTTNGALAAKGLADMSMAACFAGPLFNLLAGLGFGFLTQKDNLLSEGLKVTLLPTVRIGFAFLVVNCITIIASSFYNGGRIPKMNGYVFFGIYFAYLSMSAQHLM